MHNFHIKQSWIFTGFEYVTIFVQQMTTALEEFVATCFVNFLTSLARYLSLNGFFFICFTTRRRLLLKSACSLVLCHANFCVCLDFIHWEFFFHIFFRSLIFWIFSICATGTKPIFYSPGLSLFASSFVLFLAFHVSFQTLSDIYNLLFRLLTNLFALFCWYFYLCSFVFQLKRIKQSAAIRTFCPKTLRVYSK